MSISNRMYDRLNKLYRLVLVRMRAMDAARAYPELRLQAAATMGPRPSHSLEALEPRKLLSASPYEQIAYAPALRDSNDTAVIHVDDTHSHKPTSVDPSEHHDHDSDFFTDLPTWNHLQTYRLKHDHASPQQDASNQRPADLYAASHTVLSLGENSTAYYPSDTQTDYSPVTSPYTQPATENGSVPGIPALSSRPGAAYTLYLDFGGFSYTGDWSDYTPGTTPAYDNDGNPTAFSSTEKANIKQVWSRVAEKYAAFDINVTTVDPAIAAGQAASDLARQTYYDSQPQMMHTVIGGSASWLPSAGGTSYVGVAANSMSWLNGGHTNWVFSAQSPNNLKFIGEAAAHENGHALGLYHQSNYNGNSLVHTYSTGNSQVAPAMGNSYSAARGLWSVGTSNQHSGAPVIQNDIDILISNPNLGGFVDDGIGHFMAQATPLPIDLGQVDYTQAKGVIHPISTSNPTPLGQENYTSDWWIFGSQGGEVTLTAVSGRSTINPGYADPGSTLHTALNIYDASGDLIAELQSANLSQTFTGVLEAGNYYAQVLPMADVVDNNANYTPRSFFDMGSYFLKGSGLVEVIIDTPPSSYDFDFGTISSPILAGSAQVDETTYYSVDLGYGWQSGEVLSRDRGASAGTDAQTQDLNFTVDATFAVDLANGSYDVAVTMGDSVNYLHDQMGVYLEDNFQESVSTAKNQLVTRTYSVLVTDGQLNLRLTDLGGEDDFVTIQGLTITSQGAPVNQAPAVSDIDKALDQGGTLAFTASDFTAAFTDDDAGDSLQTIKLTGLPAHGVVALDGAAVSVDQEIALNQLANLTYTPEASFFGADSFAWTASDGQDFAVTSASVNLTINEVATPAEPSDYVFDFGTATSPLLADATPVSHATVYSAGLGYGWLSGTVDSRDRGASAGTDAQTQDLNFTTDATFAVDVANDSYTVTVILGDSADYLHDQMGVYLENNFQESVSTAKGQVVTRTYSVNVTDGQFTLRIRDLGGIDPNVTIQGLTLTSNSTPVNNPPVVSDISEVLDEDTTLAFTANDFTAAFTDDDAGDSLQIVKITSLPEHGVLELYDIAVSVNQEIAPSQLANLTYTPDEGYFGDDSFAWTASDGELYAINSAQVNLTINEVITPGLSFDFDFGTDASPLLTGATRISEATTYSAGLGYGWQSGDVLSRDRGASAGTDEQTRDLNFTTDATFAVDLPNGAYTVTVMLGDSADYLHDQMGVYLENAYQENVNSAKGQVVTRTYNVNVADGQLNLRIRDLGGIDPNVTIQGVTITSAD